MRVKVVSNRPMGERVMKYLLSQGETLVNENPDIMVIAYYDRILKPYEFNQIPLGAINFHPGLLPINRGLYPNVWPLVDGNPAGVTIHYIDEGIDTGDIIAQKRVPVYSTDIASDLEDRTQKEIFKLFKKIWPKIKKGKAPRRKQKGISSYHSLKDIKSFQEFDRETIYKLRACTFKDRSYGYFIDKGKKVYVGVKFFKKEDIDKFNKKNAK